MGRKGSGVFLSLLFLAVFLSSCAFPMGEPPTEFTPGTARHVFSAGYDYITDRYIEPVNSAELAVNGLEGLTNIDERVVVERKGERVQLALNGHLLAAYDFPQGEDSGQWADLTVEAIENTRGKSHLLHEANAETIYEAVFRGMLSGLDGYSRYASADDARRNKATREGFGGIGVQILVDKGTVRIVSVLPDTPAEEGGLEDGDVIVSIEGESTQEMTIRDVVDLLRGKERSSVTITVSREEMENPLKVTLVRKRIVGLTVSSRRIGALGYIRITSFNKRTGDSLEEVLKSYGSDLESGEIRGLILDMRSNPGGLLDQAVRVSDLFLSKGKIVFTKGRHPDSIQSFKAVDENLSYQVPLAVLINGNSASAAEIVAAALQDQGRAVVIGSNSYGKGTVQNVITLPNEGELTLTWSRFHAPSGYTLNGLGVLPTICTSAAPEETTHDDAGSGAPSLHDLKAKIVESKAVLREWRAAHVPDDPTVAKLRAICPAGKKSPDSDISAAQTILSNQVLYQKALNLSYEAVAERLTGS